MQLTKVMVIDDDAGDQFLSKNLIEEYDSEIDVVQAYDGKEALEVLDKMDNPPDVIFLDINMPVMDGHEFLREYSQREGQTTVIVMLTSSDQDIDKEKSMAYNFVKDYFTKPLDEDSLKRTTEIISSK